MRGGGVGAYHEVEHAEDVALVRRRHGVRRRAERRPVRTGAAHVSQSTASPALRLPRVRECAHRLEPLLPLKFFGRVAMLVIG